MDIEYNQSNTDGSVNSYSTHSKNPFAPKFIFSKSGIIQLLFKPQSAQSFKRKVRERSSLFCHT